MDWGDLAELLAREESVAIVQRCMDVLSPRGSAVFMRGEVKEEGPKKFVRRNLSGMADQPYQAVDDVVSGLSRLRRCLDRNW